MLIKLSADVAGGKFELHPEGVNPTLLKAFGAHVTKKRITMPMRLADLQLIEQGGFTLEATDLVTKDILAQLYRADKMDRWLADAKEIKKQATHPRWGQMMPHQHVGASFLVTHPRALLVLTPRLGKTVCTVVSADLSTRKEGKKVLIVAPLTIIKSTWVNGIKYWSQEGEDAKIEVLHGAASRKTVVKDADWFITNPESMAQNLDWFKRLIKENNIDLIVLDESILYKNRRAKRTLAAQELGQEVQRVWALTGNPLGAFQDDFFGQLSILRPDVFKSYWKFVDRWNYTEVTPWGTKVVGNQKPEELRVYLRDLVLSRTPKEVPVLPDLQFEVVPVELNKEQHRIIKEMNDEMVIRKNNGEEDIEITAKIALQTRLQQAVSNPAAFGLDVGSAKLDATMELLSYVQGPTIVWFQYQESIDQFVSTAKSKGLRVASISGAVRESTRNKAIEDFQSNNLDAIAVQLDTGKFGLDLTAARTVIYHDRNPSLDAWVQSTHRVRHVKHSEIAAGYVLHGGYSDHLIDQIIDRKITSLASLSLTDLLEFTKPTVSTPKSRAKRKVG